MQEHHVVAATATGVFGSLATSDELQSLILALLAIAVRELVYWWQHRKRSTDTDTGGMG